MKSVVWIALILALVNTGFFWLYFPNGLKKDYSKVVLSSDGRLLRPYLTQDEKWRFLTTRNDLPEFFVPALKCIEDRNFDVHLGFDPFALARALKQNVNAGRVVSGGSTLTMQLVRLLEPKKRTLLNKFFEIWAALLVEAILSKEEILDRYLSYAPYGSNIEGVGAAAQRYFGKKSSDLTLLDTSFLFLLQQAPVRLYQLDRAGWKRKLQRVMTRLRSCGIKSESVDVAAFNFSRHPLPRIAAQLADYLSEENGPTVTTTIDFSLQKDLEQRLERKRAFFYARGVKNTSVLIVDSKTAKILAAAGNFSYSFRDEQMIASFNVPRSPGSTLKPFIYAMAIENGLIVPQTLVEDIPVKFGRYSPENYTGMFSGLMKAEEALSKSLNIPFIVMLQLLNLEFVRQKFMGVGLRFENNIGLSLGVGGVEFSPLGVTQLYTSLANGGKVTPLRVTASQIKEEYPFLSEASTFLTRDALAKRGRSGYPAGVQHYDKTVYWKTGTSQNRRDAWTIGIGNRYLISVWLGNLDRSPSPHLVGAEAAAPLMFELMSAYDPDDAPEPFFPKDLAEISVCEFSGYPAGAHCPKSRTVAAYEKRIPRKICPYHKTIHVDLSGRYRVNTQCKIPAKKKSVLRFRSQLSKHLGARLKALNLKYPLHPECSLDSQKTQISIEMPAENQRFVMLQSMNENWLRIPLVLDSSYQREFLRCFLNGSEFSGSKRLLNLGRGRYRLHCVDPAGVAATRRFTVF